LLLQETLLLQEVWLLQEAPLLPVPIVLPPPSSPPHYHLHYCHLNAAVLVVSEVTVAVVYAAAEGCGPTKAPAEMKAIVALHVCLGVTAVVVAAAAPASAPASLGKDVANLACCCRSPPASLNLHLACLHHLRACSSAQGGEFDLAIDAAAHTSAVPVFVGTAALVTDVAGSLMSVDAPADLVIYAPSSALHSSPSLCYPPP
jgi:hypothetical protein